MTLSEPPSRLVVTGCSGVLAIAALALTLFGVKLLFVQHFGSNVPYWDQWNAEADLLYKSYLNSNLTASNLFSSHNEHRILITRILSLALFELHGGWDPILQMIVNAALHVGAIVLLVLNIQRIIPPSQYMLLVLFSGLLFVLPIGWENLLAGFQSQFYLLVIFSLLALMGFAVAPAFSMLWWGSLIGTIAAYFSLASGALTAVAALAVVTIQIFARTRTGVREYLAAIALLVAAVIMILFVRDVPGHAIYKAHRVAEFFRALLRCLTFPGTNPYVGIWVNLPVVVYACSVLTIRPSRQSPHWIVLGIIIWLFCQSLSLSYGRAMLVSSPRYLDIIMLSLPVNFGVLLFFISKRGNSRKMTVVLTTIAWLAIVVSGLIQNAVGSSFPAVIEKGAQGQEQLKNVLGYLKAGDLAELQGKSSQAIPYPDPARLAGFLSDPAIRLVLPDPLQPADVDEKQRLDRTFLKGMLRSKSLRIKTFVLNYAPVMIGLGIVLAFGAGLLGRARPADSDWMDAGLNTP